MTKGIGALVLFVLFFFFFFFFFLQPLVIDGFAIDDDSPSPATSASKASALRLREEVLVGVLMVSWCGGCVVGGAVRWWCIPLVPPLDLAGPDPPNACRFSVIPLS